MHSTKPVIPLLFYHLCWVSCREDALSNSLQKHTHIHACIAVGYILFHSESVLIRLVGRINACQVEALAQYRRGQTVTESGGKIIILIMMPRRPPFIYQSTTKPPSVTLSPDPPCSLHLASNLIDFLQKTSYFLSLLLFILLCCLRGHNSLFLLYS